jgi:hypothetical protein
MRLIDRIALNRAVQMILSFILSLVKIFKKESDNLTPDGPSKPKRRPVKDLLDNVLPWRK